VQCPSIPLSLRGSIASYGNSGKHVIHKLLLGVDILPEALHVGGVGIGRWRSYSSWHINDLAIVHIVFRGDDVFDVRVIVLEELPFDLPIAGFLALGLNDFLRSIKTGHKEVNAMSTNLVAVLPVELEDYLRLNRFNSLSLQKNIQITRDTGLKHRVIHASVIWSFAGV
jgi:hypothetical protein